MVLYLDYVFNEIVPLNRSFTAHHLPSSFVCSFIHLFSSNNTEVRMKRSHWGRGRKRRKGKTAALAEEMTEVSDSGQEENLPSAL